MTLNILDFGADPTGVADSTAAINAATALGRPVYAPTGTYSIDTDTGIILRTGMVLKGDGLTQTKFKAASHGATLSELTSATKGSVFKRASSSSAVFQFDLSDFSIILNHPSSFSLTNYRQIGLDLRNCMYYSVNNVLSGNIPYDGAYTGMNQVQGYGFVIGGPASPGSQGGTLNNIQSYGTYKAIAIDESTLCGTTSTAHSTVVNRAILSHSHELITQNSQYSTGIVLRDIQVQACIRQTGNTDPTIAMRISGYDNESHINYAEFGGSEPSVCDRLLDCPSASQHNRIYLQHTGATTGGATVNTGTGNNIQTTQAGGTLSLTTTGTSGAATLITNVLNVPNYATSGGGFTLLTGGTLGGNMTLYGGLASAIDGTTNSSYTACAGGSTTTSTFKVDWGSGISHTIRKFEIWGSNDYGYDSTSSIYSPTVKLQGSNDNFTTTVDLYTLNFTDDNTSQPKSISSGITTTTPYRYHQLLITGTGGGALLAEVKLYE